MGTASRLHLQCNQLRNKYERYISIISVDALNYHRSMTEHSRIRALALVSTPRLGAKAMKQE